VPSVSVTPLSETMDGLGQLILDLDPARTTWARIRDRARAQTEELSRKLERVKEQLAARIEGAELTRANEILARASALMGELQDALTEQVDAARWRSLYARLAQTYEDLRGLLASLPTTVPDHRVARISRTNLSRSVFHAAMGLGAALLYHFVLTRTQAIVIMAVVVSTFTGLELGRRRSSAMNDFLMRLPLIKRIARPHEYFRVNSATYFAFGLLLAAIAFPQVAVELGCVILAVADPVASTLGRRFGRTKLYRDKSLVGTSAFIGAGAAAGALYLALLFPAVLNPGAVVLLAVGAAAAAEALTSRLDDNLTIPLAAALAASFAL
jgi:dolichol kinase